MQQCGCKTEVFSRVVGYHRPVNSWNKGKQEEFKDRREYAVPTTMPDSQAVPIAEEAVAIA